MMMMMMMMCEPGVSHRHLSDHLSELVENTLSDLEHSKVSHDCYCVRLSQGVVSNSTQQ